VPTSGPREGFLRCVGEIGDGLRAKTSSARSGSPVRRWRLAGMRLADDGRH
jgi:hypothetical protein